MTNPSPRPDPEAILAEAYPHLTHQQLKELGAALCEYAEFVLEIFERLQQDPEALAAFEAKLEEGKS